MGWLIRTWDSERSGVRLIWRLGIAAVWFLVVLTSGAQNKPDPAVGALPHPIEQLRADPQWRVYAAVVTHDHKALQTLLDAGDSPNGVQASNGAPLAMAGLIGDLEAVKILLKSGADIDRLDGFGIGVNALIYATSADHIEVVRYLLSRGAQVNARDTLYGDTAVLVALRSHNPEMISLLKNAGADVNLSNKSGFSLLMTAAWENDYDQVKFLEANGAKFNSPDEELLYAVIRGDVAEIQRVLAAGAKVNQSYRYGRTPLMLAAQNGETAAVKVLIGAGADINAICSNGETPLMYAISSRHKSTILAVLDAGPDLNVAANGGATALSELAMQLDDPDLVRLLIRRGASVDGAGGANQFTPLMAAASSGSVQTERILLEAHVPVNAQNTEGGTALIQAATFGQIDTVALLLRAGADASIKDKKGMTALDHAIQLHREEVIAILQKRLSQPANGKPASDK